MHRLVQQAAHPEIVHLHGLVGALEGDAHVGLCGKIVDLVRLRLLERGAQRGAVAQIAVDDMDPSPRMHEPVDPHHRIETGAADEAPYLVPEVEEMLGQIRAVLPRYAGDERSFVGHVRCDLVCRSYTRGEVFRQFRDSVGGITRDLP